MISEFADDYSSLLTADYFNAEIAKCTADDKAQKGIRHGGLA